MRKPVEVVLVSMMQTIHSLDGVPQPLYNVFMAMDRIFPAWRPPTCNLANPPKIDKFEDKPMAGTVTFHCPVCGLQRTHTMAHESELRDLADAITLFRQTAMCAHDDDKTGMSVDVAPQNA